MIWSLTPYNGEADVLEIRLGTLDGVVDRHVLCEGTTTHRGDPKPLHFPEQLERFEPWLDKITYQICSFRPRGEVGNWAREHAQRDHLIEALDGEDSNTVLISDLDEIPDPAYLDPAICENGPVRLEMSMHLYYLNWRWRENPVRSGTRAILARASKLRAHDRTLTEFVEAGWPVTGDTAGWHFAYMMDAAGIRQKIASIADEWCYEYAEKPLEHFEYCRQTGQDLFNRDYRKCDWVPDSELPFYVQQNRERFARLLIAEPQEVAA